jgi:carbonic anhydrase
MSLISSILEYNRAFVEEKRYEEYRTTKFPDKKMVVVTCMDTRLVELLPQAMNLKNGDAKIIKSAGAIVSHPFGSIMRSILVAVYSLGAEEVCVVGHHDCGMTGLNPEIILQKAKERNISQDTINTIYRSGIDLNRWLSGFTDVHESVRSSVDIINLHPLMPKEVAVHGLIIDPHTGKLELIIDGYEENKLSG